MNLFTMSGKKKLIFQSLQFRMLLFFTLLISLPFLIISIHFISLQNESHINENVKKEEEISHRLVVNLKSQLTTYVEISQQIYFNTQFSSYLADHYENPGASAEGYYRIIAPYFKTIFSLHKDIQGITLYVDNPTILINGAELDYMTNLPFHQDLIQMMNRHNGQIFWFFDTDVNTLFLLRKLNPRSGEGIMSISISGDLFERLIRDENANIQIEIPNGYIFINNPSSPLIPDKEKNTLKLIENEFSLGTFSKDIWRVKKYIDMDDYQAQMNSIRATEISLMGFIILITLLLGILFSLHTGKGIGLLSRGMRELEEGCFTARIEESYGGEIGGLIDNFNNMAHRLDELVTKAYRYELDKKELILRTREAQFFALQSQINPHFLFNTIDSIMMELEEDPENAGKMLGCLARFYRRNLKLGNENIMLKHEMEMVREYLILQTFRFQDRLTWEIEISEELEKVYLPRLIIQPLVENAITHGIAPKTKGGKVHISVYKIEGGMLAISIKDNGLGFVPERLESIKKVLESDNALGLSGDHVGLYNIAIRIKLRYPKQGRMDIFSRYGEGTEVILMIPEELSLPGDNLHV